MQIPSELHQLARRTSGLRLLVLYGSRARGDASQRSDWDFGYLADRDCDIGGLAASLGAAVGSDDVDLVDLARASGLLRQRAASEGRLVFARHGGDHERFVIEAVRFWLDAGRTISQSQEAVLERLG
jgi:predicted nucleotidyltransferase